MSPSSAVLARFITKEKKVGHGGTLDPFAEGVLIIATGKDTKQLTEVTGTDKSYIATIRLGEITNTLDTEGVVTEKKDVPSLNDDKIVKVLHTFLGETKQIPPMFSAKKIGGKKLYELARNNIEVERVKALKAFVKESLEGKFPAAENSVNVDEKVLQDFLKRI